MKFRPLTVVVPIDKIIKGAIRAVLESIYDSEFPGTAHSRPGRGCHSVLIRMIKEWGTPRWFLEFGIIVSTPAAIGNFEISEATIIKKHRLISILKEEIDDPKLFRLTHKLFSAGRLVGGYRGGRPSPSYGVVPHSVLLSALLGNIHLHKLDQEIERLRQQHEIPIVQIIKLVPLERIDNRGGPAVRSREEASFYSPPVPVGYKRAIVGPQREAAFFPLFFVRTPSKRRRGDLQTPPLVSPPLAVFRPSGPAAFLIREGFSGRRSPRRQEGGERPFYYYNTTRGDIKNGVTLFPAYDRCCRRRDLLIELGGELVIGLERRLVRKRGLSSEQPFNDLYLIRICHARYADDLPLGIAGTVELIRGIQKRITHFIQSGLNLEVGSAGSTYIAARSTVEFLGTVIRGVPSRAKRASFARGATPIKLLRELEKRRRAKRRIHITASHLRSAIHSKLEDLGGSIPIQQLAKGMGTGGLQDAVKLAEILGTASVLSPGVSVGVFCFAVKHIRRRSGEISCRSNVPEKQAVSRSGKSLSVWELSLYTPGGREAGEGRGHWFQTGSFSSMTTPRRSTTQIKAPVKKILQRLRDRGLISRRRPWPTHVACLTNASDEEIVNRFAGVAISPLSHHRCCDNLYKVQTIVDYQIRRSAISTPAHKHKSSARLIIQKYSKDSNIVNKEDGKTLAEFPNSIKLRKLRPESLLKSKYIKNKEHAYKTLYQVYIRDVRSVIRRSRGFGGLGEEGQRPRP
nr:maturase-related protein [Gnetum hainanense]